MVVGAPSGSNNISLNSKSKGTTKTKSSTKKTRCPNHRFKKKNLLNPFTFRPHIFFISCSFLAIKKIMGIPIKIFKNTLELQRQWNNVQRF